MIKRALVLTAVLLLAGCGGTPYMREALPSEILTAPPPGKVLVNFNRDSGYGGHRVFAFFDGTKFVGCNLGEQRVQYVCEPGQHIFIGYLTSSIWATTSVVWADLQPDKVYDCIVDIGYFTSMIALNAIKRGDARRENFADWDVDQDTMVLDDTTNWQEYENDQREANAKMEADARAKAEIEEHRTLAPTDHRD